MSTKSKAISFHDKIQSGYYKSKLPYVRHDKAYEEDSCRLAEEFKRDLFEYHGVTGAPKVEVAFRLAEERGHAHGFSEIASEFEDLVELLGP